MRLEFVPFEGERKKDTVCLGFVISILDETCFLIECIDTS